MVQRNLIFCQLKRFVFLLSLTTLLTLLHCFPFRKGSVEQDIEKANDPFVTYDSYIQEDLLLSEMNSDHDRFVRQVISTLNNMCFPVDSCLSLGSYTFIKTAFVLNPKRFRTPKHHFLKISLLVEVPRQKDRPIEIKYAVCTTCARCERWYCDQLPAWAMEKKYQIIPKIQELIFEFKKKLLDSDAGI